jgi:hypothetical protein
MGYTLRYRRGPFDLPPPYEPGILEGNEFEFHVLDEDEVDLGHVLIRDDKVELKSQNAAEDKSSTLLMTESTVQASVGTPSGIGLVNVGDGSLGLSAGDGTVSAAVDLDVGKAQMLFADGVSVTNVLAVTAAGLLYSGEAPEVPASPTEQDIVDVLVGLGFITQAE